MGTQWSRPREERARKPKGWTTPGRLVDLPGDQYDWSGWVKGRSEEDEVREALGVKGEMGSL